MTIARIEAKIDKLFDNQAKIREDIASLKVKSGVWGFIGGCILSVPTLLILFFKGKW